MSPEPLLNYVRCPYCGGNLADMNHPCDEDARQRAANEAVAKLMTDLNTPTEEATAEQLRRKLLECEAALNATEELVPDGPWLLRSDLTPILDRELSCPTPRNVMVVDGIVSEARCGVCGWCESFYELEDALDALTHGTEEP